MLQEYSIENKKIVEVQSGNIKLFYNPTEEEKELMVKVYKIDEHTLSSALDDDEISRMEYEPDHTAMIVKSPRKYVPRDEYLFRVMSLGIFLYNDKLIIVANDEVDLFQGKQMQTVESLMDLIFKMIYRFVFNFLEHLKIINKVSEDLEHKINAAMENKYLINLFSLEKSLVYYLNAINSNNVLMEKIKNNANRMELHRSELEILDDIIIENNQCYHQAEIYANILAGLMDARASIVSNNLNVLMKTLNIVTLGFMVPTFVVSAFSMNVRIPLQDQHNAFYFVMGLAFLSVIGLLLLMWWRKW